MRRNNSSRKSHHSESSSSFTSLYSNSKQKEPIISIEKEETKNYSYNTFLQRMERLITKNEKIKEFPMSTLKKEMQMMKPEDVELYVQQMLKEKKTLYSNEILKKNNPKNTAQHALKNREETKRRKP